MTVVETSNSSPSTVERQKKVSIEHMYARITGIPHNTISSTLMVSYTGSAILTRNVEAQKEVRHFHFNLYTLLISVYQMMFLSKTGTSLPGGICSTILFMFPKPKRRKHSWKYRQESACLASGAIVYFLKMETLPRLLDIHS